MTCRQRLSKILARLSGVQLVCCIPMAFTALGCESSPSQKPSPRWEDVPQAKAEGPEAKDADFLLEVSAPEKCEMDGVLAPKPGTLRFTIPFRITGRTSREIPVSPLTFSLEDREGNVFRPTLAGCKETFAPASVKQGQEISGYLTFDVERSSQLFEILFEPYVVGRKPIKVRARLPRK